MRKYTDIVINDEDDASLLIDALEIVVATHPDKDEQDRASHLLDTFELINPQLFIGK